LGYFEIQRPTPLSPEGITSIPFALRPTHAIPKPGQPNKRRFIVDLSWESELTKRGLRDPVAPRRGVAWHPHEGRGVSEAASYQGKAGWNLFEVPPNRSARKRSLSWRGDRVAKTFLSIEPTHLSGCSVGLQDSPLKERCTRSTRGGGSTDFNSCRGGRVC